MAGKSHDAKKTLKAVVPEKLAGSALFDDKGREWKMRKFRKPKFGLFHENAWKMEEQGTTSGAALDAILREFVCQALQSWIANDAGPALEGLTENTQPLIQRCIMEGERTFRKEFITKLGAQGEAVWKQILNEQFEEIERLLAHHGKKETSFFSSGLLPAAARFHWRAESSNSFYDLFCFEFPPGRRTIKFVREREEEFVRLAFPWLCFLAGFRNGKLLHMPWSRREYGGSYALWSFYRNEHLKSEDDALLLSNLPNGYKEAPFHWCLGTEAPAIQLGDPLWYEKLMGWFWDSAFRSDWGYYQERQAISFWDWKNLSESEPEKICSVSWQKSGYSLGAFARYAMGEFEKQEGRVETRDSKTISKARAVLTRKFRERLEEELLFLGARLAVPVDTRESARAFVKERFNEIVKILLKKAGERCERVGEKTMERFLRR